MPADNPQFPDPRSNEVDVNDLSAVERWTEHWNITEVELRKAIAEVGTNAIDVSIILGKAVYGGSDIHQAGVEGGSGHSAPA